MGRRVAVVVGTRPEIIKMAPVVKECQRRGADFFIIHSGQHYSYGLDGVFFKQLGLPRPDYRLDVGSDSRERQVLRICAGVERAVAREGPDVVLVQGDTNTVLAGALVAAKLRKRLGHVEAGLRSFDARMPEEFNRIVADSLSTHLFAPTATAKRNLRVHSGITAGVHVTGNTVVDAIRQNLEASDGSDVLERLSVGTKDFALVSLHRQENVDDGATFARVVAALRGIRAEHGIPVVFPMHPRSRKMAKRFGVDLGGISVTSPVDYFAFLRLQRHARFVLTDSGGVQEEACVLGTPCVTLRESTERPETVDVGANIVAGTRPDRILRAAARSAGKRGAWDNPFGGGDAARRIMDIVSGLP